MMWQNHYIAVKWLRDSKIIMWLLDHYIVVKPLCNVKIITLQFPKNDVSKNLVFKRIEIRCLI